MQWRWQDKYRSLKWVREGLWLILTATSIITLVAGSNVEWEHHPPSTAVTEKEFGTWRAGKELTFRLVNE